MSWWFPTFTPSGDVISGDGEVWLNGKAIGPGYSPVSIDATRAIVAEPTGILHLPTGGHTPLPWAFSGRVGNVPGVSGGAGHWCGFNPHLGLVHDAALLSHLAAPGSIDRLTGRLSYLTPYQSDLRDVVVAGQVVRRGALASEIRAADGAVVWSEWEAGVRKLWGFRGIAPERLSVMDPAEAEFTAVPVMCAGEHWIVVGTHEGLIVYPWLDPWGYILIGEYFYHDAAFLQDRIRIVATTGKGEIQHVELELTSPRVDLRLYHPSSHQPPPIDPPEDEMEPPVVTVNTWTLDELLDGREMVFHDSANPDLGYQARVHVAGGNMYAELWNAKGHASTGQARPVKPCDGDHEPDKPPPDPEPSSTTITTWRGTFWQCSRDGLIEQSDRPDKFTITTVEPGKVTIQAPNGLFVCAEDRGQADKLIANRVAAGEWETFATGPSGDGERPGGFTLRAVNDRYVSAEGDGRITVNRVEGTAWETFEGDRPRITLPRLVVDQKYFRQDTGARWSAIQCSDFSLYKYWLDGQAIDPVLEQRAALGFNCLRVWLLNTSVIPGGLIPGDYIAFYDALPDFLARCEAFGLYVELTAFTQTASLMPDDSDQLAHFQDVIDAVRGSRNVLVELTNEHDQHDNATSADFPRPSGVLASSGSNGSDHPPPVPPLWDYVLWHTNDQPEWMRKCGHNAMADGADVYGVPCMSNENTRAIDRDADLDHFYDAAAGAALLCAGACFHSQAGKLSQVWGGHELECAKAWVAGARSVPLEYQPGAYSRHDELNGPDCIRAYRRTLPDGRSWTVKIRP